MTAEASRGPTGVRRILALSALVLLAGGLPLLVAECGLRLTGHEAI